MFCLSKRRKVQTEIEDDDSLCSICSALDLRAILHDGIRESHAISLGCLTDIANKHDQCGLCRLICNSYFWFRRGNDLSGINCTLYTRKRRSPLNYSNLSHHLYIPESFTEIRLLNDLEADSRVGGLKEFRGQRVGQNVDVGLLKKWIRTCKKKHGEACETHWWRGSGEVLPSTVRVVDVVRMAIVRAPLKCCYVALSYVWGGTGERYWTTQANLKQRGIPGGLDTSMLPNTISDTIQLVRQLGERYVWIDALCIVQDDPEDKAVQLGVMDVIYGNSAFTIIAAGCNSAQDPLPGIRPGTRDPKQHIAKVQGLHLALPLPEASEVIANSAWNERGWTYQEVMLSRRRIFFTAHQVYFQCEKGTCGEEVVSWHLLGAPVGTHLPTGAPLSSLAREHDIDIADRNSRMIESCLSLYTSAVPEYTQRRLTVESDIVDGVAAILRGLTKGFNLADGNYCKAFRFGMLLAGCLEQALLWQPTANAPNSRRVPTDEMRVAWPSWSWAAWRGGVKYVTDSVFVCVHLEADVGPTVGQSLVEWYIVDDDGHPVRQDMDHPKTMFIREHDIDLIKPSITYVAPKAHIDPQQLISESAPLLPGTLVFWTSYSRFALTKAHDVNRNDANYVIYSILSDIPQPSTLVGRIILPSSTQSPTSYELVVLSRARQWGRLNLYDEERLGTKYPGCMLYVMAVQKMQDERRFERVGVGIIFEQAWLNSAPEERIIYLG